MHIKQRLPTLPQQSHPDMKPIFVVHRVDLNKQGQWWWQQKQSSKNPFNFLSLRKIRWHLQKHFQICISFLATLVIFTGAFQACEGKYDSKSCPCLPRDWFSLHISLCSSGTVSQFRSTKWFRHGFRGLSHWVCWDLRTAVRRLAPLFQKDGPTCFFYFFNRPIFSKVPPAMAIYGNLLTEDLTEAQLQLAKKLKAEANFRTFALQGLRVPKDGQGVNTG